jgi:hypothetical protein
MDRLDSTMSGIPTSLMLMIVSASIMSALPLTWTLNATFADGGTAVGLFTFNSDTDTFSNWNVSATGGDTSVFFPFDFTPADSSLFFNGDDPSGLTISFASDALFPDPIAGQPESLVLAATLASMLSDAGGTISITPGVISGSFSAECFDCDPYRLITTGNVTTTPEPNSFALMAVGICVFSCAVMVCICRNIGIGFQQASTASGRREHR